MNTQLNTTDNTMTQKFNARDYRIQYMDIYTMSSGSDLMPSIQAADQQEIQFSSFKELYFEVKATDEFPLLADAWICFIVEFTIPERLNEWGLKINFRSLSKQAWAERVLRSFGLTGVKVPSTMRERIALRWKVYMQSSRESYGSFVR